MKLLLLLSGVAAGLVASLAQVGAAQASERHFTYTYESNVLNPGEAEFEPWTTFRFGREDYYSRIDQRLEFELGLAPRLQGALYWNFASVAADSSDASGATVREHGFEFTSASAEFKYKLSDPVADALGSALYLEGSLGPLEGGVEAKIILDKQLGRVLLAGNLIGEYESEWAVPGEPEAELEAEVSIGAGYFITDEFVAGAEIRQANEFEEAKELESAVVYAGPALAWRQDNWWLAATGLFQLAALKGAADGRSLDLEHQERYQVRLLLGFDL
jgi:hypothetical protein